LWSKLPFLPFPDFFFPLSLPCSLPPVSRLATNVVLTAAQALLCRLTPILLGESVRNVAAELSNSRTGQPRRRFIQGVRRARLAGYGFRSILI
jgi:hypothetical protein